MSQVTQTANTTNKCRAGAHQAPINNLDIDYHQYCSSSPLTPHVQCYIQQRFMGGAPSLTPTNHKHSHLTLSISMIQTAPSIKLASFIHQAHFPVKVSFINVSHMGFDSGLSIPQYGAFLLAVDNCWLWCHHRSCWRLPPRTSLICWRSLLSILVLILTLVSAGQPGRDAESV